MSSSHPLGAGKTELLTYERKDKYTGHFAEQKRAENQPGDRIYSGKSDPRIGEAEHEKAEQLNHQLVSRALGLGGTCTGEHGVGLHKMGFLVDEAGAGAIDMMRAIKRALDPKNILNPGKIFAL